MAKMKDTLESIAYQFGYKSDDWDIDAQEYALAMIMLMEDFIRKYEDKNYNYIKRHYDKDIDKLQEKMLKANDRYYGKMINNYLTTRANKHKIPSNKTGSIPRTFDFETTKDVIITTIKNIADSLKKGIEESIKVKEDTDNDFNINGKLKEAIKRTKGAVEYGSRVGGEKANRTVEEFVYGENARFKWVTRGDSRVCDWCRLQEKMPPRPLKDIPFDHPNGRCTVEPANEETTEAYNELLGI